MGKNRIKFIVVLMSISLTGLIIFQLYWIRNSIAIERERFARRVFEALNQVVIKLEKAETVYYIADKTSQIFHHDTIPSIIFREEEQVVKKFRFSDTLLSNKKEVFKINTPSAWSGQVDFSNRFNFKDSVFTNLEHHLFEIPTPPSPPTLDSVHKTIKRNIERISNREAIISQVMQDVLRPNIDLRSRISKDLLQKYLEEEFKNKGLELKYTFAVKTDKNNYLFTGSTVPDFVKESEFKMKLFPNDLFAGNNFLIVHFPDKYNYILQKTWLTLLASALLIGVIIYCFSYAVITLVKQKKLSEMKNDFINNMTHEFKTPIATVALTCEALEDPDVKKNEQLLHRYVSVIKEENKRLGRQVEKVLQIASLDKKDFKLVIKEVDLHEIVKHAVETLAIQVKSRGGEIIENYQATNTRLEADELHVTNILYNLLDNANKYSPDVPRIEVSTRNSDEGIIIRVKDNGIGISKDQLSRIFEKFYRVPTGNVHDVKGFGLGLAYVKTMVEAHHGSISAESEPGKGSTFELYLPFKAAKPSTYLG